MEPKDKNSEVYRIWDLSAGYHWVADDTKMLFAILSNVAPRESHLVEFDGVIPPSYADNSKILYKIVTNSPELKGLAAQRISLAIEEFLGSFMNPAEMKDFKKNNPMQFKHYNNILEELEAEGIS
jgi:hypothetical protein